MLLLQYHFVDAPSFNFSQTLLEINFSLFLKLGADATQIQELYKILALYTFF